MKLANKFVAQLCVKFFHVRHNNNNTSNYHNYNNDDNIEKKIKVGRRTESSDVS